MRRGAVVPGEAIIFSEKQSIAVISASNKGAGGECAYLSTKKHKTASSRAIARRSLACLLHPVRDCFVPRNEARFQFFLSMCHSHLTPLIPRIWSAVQI